MMSKLLNKVLDVPQESVENKISIEQAQSLILSKNKKVAFFAGAGFSKAYKEDYPLGFNLFSVDDFQTLKANFNFYTIANDLGIKAPCNESGPEFNKDCYRFFSQIKYHLDIYKRYPSLMPSFLDYSGIHFLEEEIRKFIKNRFVDLVGEDELQLNCNTSSNLTSFFESIVELKDFTFITTNYDYVIEKLLYHSKPSIKINRGITSKKCFDEVNTGRATISLFKINGGFDIHQDHKGRYCVDYSSKEVPNIILPSEEQNYDDKYFRTIFLKSAEKLRQAELLIFVGYSLPYEDKAIQFLLKNFSDSTSNNKQIIFMGRSYNSAKEKLAKLRDLFPAVFEKGGVSLLDGSFEDFIKP
ncbi:MULTISPECIES: SIR2 family protein [Pseudoalteromonas]|uniref:SIR2 family protein n=2 Tax=Pseudoalteromonas TaxID=53246 RepID=UPI0009DF0AC9